jgi:hypothetical protein
MLYQRRDITKYALRKLSRKSGVKKKDRQSYPLDRRLRGDKEI